MKPSADRAEGAKPGFSPLAALVGNDQSGIKIKPGGGGQGDPVLGAVGLVLVAVELDLHALM